MLIGCKKANRKALVRREADAKVSKASNQCILNSYTLRLIAPKDHT